MVEYGANLIYHDICKSFLFIFTLFLFEQRRPVIPGGVVPRLDILPNLCRNPVEDLNPAVLYWACPKGKSKFRKERKST